MSEETTIFPPPVDIGLHAQAKALARAAWLMAAQDGSVDPPDAPGVAPELPQGISPAGARCPAKPATVPLGGEELPP